MVSMEKIAENKKILKVMFTALLVLACFQNLRVVPFMDGGTLYDRALYEQIRTLADTHGIPTQTKTRIAGGTDAASIQRSLSGVRVAAISLPCRYIHTASCVAAVSDMIACTTLGIALAKA